MRTKRSQEAYVLIDHRNSPGVSPEFIHKNHLDVPAVKGGVTYESAMNVCHCCERDIILNPDRTRERKWCWVHDAYTCDWCAAAQKAGAACIPLKQRLAELYEKFLRRQAA